MFRTELDKKNVSQIEKYCESQNPYYLNEPLVIEKKETIFYIEKLMIDSVFNSKQLDLHRSLLNYKKVPISINNTVSTYNESISGIFNSFKFSRIEYLWIKKQSEYIKRMFDIDDIFNVIGYTLTGYKPLNLYLNNLHERSFNEIKIILDKLTPTEYFPFFFPCLHIFRVTDPLEIFKKDVKDSILIKFNIQKLTKTSSIYDEFLNLYHLFSDNFWFKVLNQYSNDLCELIDKLPRSSDDMIIYRGVKDIYTNTEENLNHISGNNRITNKAFSSCSIDIKEAMKFTKGDCCLKIIKFPRHSKALFTFILSSYNTELELLLRPSDFFYHTMTKNLKVEDDIIESADLDTQLNCKNDQHLERKYDDYTLEPLRGYIKVYYLSYIFYRIK